SKLQALTCVVHIVVIFTLLKNLFIYLSLLLLNPIKNGVMRQLRDRLFRKTLSLPIGYFNEEKKGDLMSRMTNDINEVEVSVISVLEVIIREPVTILLTLSYMIYISPHLTLFLLVFLPVVGIVIGKIGRSLKKPSGQAQHELSGMMATVEESLGGMRVLKAFNAERHQLLKFRTINNRLFRTRNRLNARRDA